METSDIINQIEQLPLSKKFYIMEETLKRIKKEEIKHQMQMASDKLYNNYAGDKELTAFTSLDYENFYEAK